MTIVVSPEISQVIERVARDAESCILRLSDLDKATREIARIAGDELLTRKQLAERWKISIRNLENLYKCHGMPVEYIPPGSGGRRPRVRFRLADVVAWRKKWRPASRLANGDSGGDTR